jgi:hypothetical protein
MLRYDKRDKKASGAYLVLICGSHVLDDLFGLCFCDTAVFGQDLSQNGVDFTSHVGGVATDVEVGLLLNEFVNLLAALLETVLDVNLLGTFS